MIKSDFLKDCLIDIQQQLRKSVPIDQFSAEFCTYCLNNECSRSGTNNMLFQIRSKEWYNNKFLNVPRADDNDNKYDLIRNKWYKAPSSEIITSIENTNVAEPTNTSGEQEEVEEKASDSQEEPKPSAKKQTLKKSAKAPKKTPDKKEKKVTAKKPKQVMMTSPEGAPSLTEAPDSMNKIVPKAISPSKSSNTRWDEEQYIGEQSPNSGSTSNDIVIAPGGSFKFGG